jgi:hypothetical protein
MSHEWRVHRSPITDYRFLAPPAASALDNGGKPVILEHFGGCGLKLFG